MLFLTVVRSKATLWQGSCQISALQNHCGLGQAAVGTATRQSFRPIGGFSAKIPGGGVELYYF